MNAKRIIPCLDVKNGRVVKGVNFVNLIDAGDPVDNVLYYEANGADEIIFLDITASSDKRDIILPLVKKVSEKLFIPFCVGGGVRTIEDIRLILEEGADKVAINTAAFNNPEILQQAAYQFGSQCIVCAIDSKYNVEKKIFEVFLNGGRTPTGKSVLEWAKQAEDMGAGEILLTSMDRDGTKLGYDLELLNAVSSKSSIPIIASGGAGTMEHFKEAFEAKASAVLAASLFHFKEVCISDLKKYLAKENIVIRPL